MDDAGAAPSRDRPGPARVVGGGVDLHSVQEVADPTQRGAVSAARDRVSSAVAALEERMMIRRLDPAVTALRQHVSGLVDQELSRLHGKYSAPMTADIEWALHRVSQALLHTPTLRAQEHARTGDGAGYVRALHTLFGIDIDITDTKGVLGDTVETDRFSAQQISTRRIG